VKPRPIIVIAVAACCIGAIGGAASAQVSVAVTSTVAITVPAGSNISNAGSFTVTNNSGASITISSINLSATSPGIFSSLTLTGQVPGSSSISAPSSPNPPSTSNTFDFSALPVLLNGQAATFTLSGIASSTAAPTPTPGSSSLDLDRGRMAYAGMAWPSASGQPKMPAVLLIALTLGVLLMTGKLRRRHFVVLAMGLILAATEVGCGNTITGTTGTSTQVVQTITVSSGGAATGLPASLGSITVQ
jgi:type IV secretory pathway VirB2 component (pilin)